MLALVENKRLTAAAAAATVLLVLVGFGAGRLSGPSTASSAPSTAALTVSSARLQTALSGDRGALHAAQEQAARLPAVARETVRLRAANHRLGARLAAVRACAAKRHPRRCLRAALR